MKSIIDRLVEISNESHQVNLRLDAGEISMDEAMALHKDINRRLMEIQAEVQSKQEKRNYDSPLTE